MWIWSSVDLWGWASENQIAAGVISGLIVLVIAAIPKARKPLFDAVSRFFRWIGGLRVTTRKQRDATISAALDSKQGKHFVRPQFVIFPQDKDLLWTWHLYNTAENSVAAHVRLSVDETYFQISSAVDWERFEGPGLREFRGVPTNEGRLFGVGFTVEWVNVNGESDSSMFVWAGVRPR